jgi:hypothetical protein
VEQNGGWRGFFLYSSANLKSGVKLAPGSGSWSSLSDRAAKTGIENIDDARILAKRVAKGGFRPLRRHISSTKRA